MSEDDLINYSTDKKRFSKDNSFLLNIFRETEIENVTFYRKLQIDFSKQRYF